MSKAVALRVNNITYNIILFKSCLKRASVFGMMKPRKRSGEENGGFMAKA
jgi:hypothetical protein